LFLSAIELACLEIRKHAFFKGSATMTMPQLGRAAAGPRQEEGRERFLRFGVDGGAVAPAPLSDLLVRDLAASADPREKSPAPLHRTCRMD
jgi:hypothetical protein